MVFGIDIPVLKARKKGQFNQLSAEFLQACLGSNTARMALADFRKAIRNPEGTGFHCYRAAEVIMQSMKEGQNKSSDSAAWARMRDRLRIHRSALDKLKEYADYPGHGRPLKMTDEERAQVFQIADEIIGRFLRYLVNGQTPLPPEAPMFKT